ncbi:MAG: hypothetical protein ACR2M0_02365 [Chloroflexia bacterium]
MPNNSNPDTIALHVFVPKQLKQAIETQTVANKYKPSGGPTTLTELVILALQNYLEDQDDVRAYDAAKARIDGCEDTLIPLDQVLADLEPASA